MLVACTECPLQSFRWRGFGLSTGQVPQEQDESDPVETMDRHGRSVCGGHLASMQSSPMLRCANSGLIERDNGPALKPDPSPSPLPRQRGGAFQAARLGVGMEAAGYAERIFTTCEAALRYKGISPPTVWSASPGWEFRLGLMAYADFLCGLWDKSPMSHVDGLSTRQPHFYGFPVTLDESVPDGAVDLTAT